MKSSGVIDQRARVTVDDVVAASRSVIGENLISVILHGSLAMGSYHFPKSDIDLLIIVEGPLSPGLRKEFFQKIMEISSKRQTVGDIELSVVQRKNLGTKESCVPYGENWDSEVLLNFRNSFREIFSQAGVKLKLCE